MVEKSANPFSTKHPPVKAHLRLRQYLQGRTQFKAQNEAITAARSHQRIELLKNLGVAVVAAFAVGVMLFKPSSGHPDFTAVTANQIAPPVQAGHQTELTNQQQELMPSEPLSKNRSRVSAAQSKSKSKKSTRKTRSTPKQPSSKKIVSSQQTQPSTSVANEPAANVITTSSQPQVSTPNYPQSPPVNAQPNRGGQSEFGP